MKVATENITETIAELLAHFDHVGKPKVRAKVRLAPMLSLIRSITAYFSA